MEKVGYAEGAVQTILKEGRSFRRNNQFLIECWEAMYTRMIQLFLEGKGYVAAVEPEAVIAEVETQLGCWRAEPSEQRDAAAPAVSSLPKACPKFRMLSFCQISAQRSYAKGGVHRRQARPE